MTDLSYTIVWSAAAGVAAGILVWEVLRAWPLLERFNRSERQVIGAAELAEKCAAEDRKRVGWALDQARAAKAAHDASQAGKEACETQLDNVKVAVRVANAEMAAAIAQANKLEAELWECRERLRRVQERPRGAHGHFAPKEKKLDQVVEKPSSSKNNFSSYLDKAYKDD